MDFSYSFDIQDLANNLIEEDPEVTTEAYDDHMNGTT